MAASNSTKACLWKYLVCRPNRPVCYLHWMANGCYTITGRYLGRPWRPRFATRTVALRVLVRVASSGDLGAPGSIETAAPDLTFCFERDGWVSLCGEDFLIFCHIGLLGSSWWHSSGPRRWLALQRRRIVSSSVGSSCAQRS